ncbi:aldolase [Leucobacter sp. OLJS4]|uniref:DUF6986 family protein n=1 Tax=unclassified Leucobacter TaxID=2621730 RepID=UPI000C196C1F|nr:MULTISPECIES: aldolase/citrate lyase family protein [unclassified Leucobacter]PIJ43374.1 aldolase [Leucobacter sp. OLES1]PII84103.1 aldolase [Leucobacter sp. OLCALW19]PII88352.1 aldolase [Leucobacter sp. OLTLW20]PII92281.1 aldolase [Leucobacter sp. OLAS13]PII99527.1 aldolase [Leucobacter sp. OLCS4]
MHHRSALIARLTQDLDRELAPVDRRLAEQYPGRRTERQPIHTVYVPADRFSAATIAEWGAEAISILDADGGDAASLAEAVELPVEIVEELLPRVRRKLVTEPVEDLRIDFEDGYGPRPDAEEDAAAITAATALAELLAAEGPKPMRAGIRFKCFEAATRARGLRTLGLFVGALAEAGAVDRRFVVTLPKVTAVEQVSALVGVLGALEREHRLDPGVLRFEIQVETPQSILAADGTALVARLIHASAGRCTALHYGTYDYSASCGIVGRYQSMEHPAADHAKAVMQVAAAGTGVELSDGSTNVLPVGDRDRVRAGWRLHTRLVRRSLERGFYQGWDLHPGQFATRFLATYAFFRDGLDVTVRRLAAYAGVGAPTEYLDEPATAAALADTVVRGLECGAIAESELGALDRGTLVRLRR